MNPKELLSQIAQNLEKIARERDELRDVSAKQKEEIILLKAEISELKGQVKKASESAPVIENLNSSSNSGEIKKRIDGLVEEIDECLALLNN
jgi:uncharacterized coiled-coil DUF342 family protein